MRLMNLRDFDVGDTVVLRYTKIPPVKKRWHGDHATVIGKNSRNLIVTLPNGLTLLIWLENCAHVYRGDRQVGLWVDNRYDQQGLYCVPTPVQEPS